MILKINLEGKLLQILTTFRERNSFFRPSATCNKKKSPDLALEAYLVLVVANIKLRRKYIRREVLKF